jgi:cobalt-zinc-cadmium efflux system membrane fusion protein
MKKTVIILALLTFAFCGGRDKKVPPTAEEQQPRQIKEGHELQLSPEKQKEWGIVVRTATKDTLVAKISLPGVITLNQNKTAHISSFVHGKVVSLATDMGDRVRRDQALVTINSPEFAQAQADFLEARAKLNFSQKEYERAKMLFKEKAIEERELLRREAEHERLATEFGSSESILHSYGLDQTQIEGLIKKCTSLWNEADLCELANPNLPILSPVAGTVIFRDVIVGEHVDPQKILLTVSNLNILWALLDAYEKDLPFINRKSAVTIQSPLYPEKEFKGTISYISDIIDEKLRTIKIRVEVENPGRLLKPNMYIQGIVENKAVEREALAIPEEAIQNLDGEKIVFILEDEDVFAAHHVELGEKIGNKRIIARGLREGEKIVIKGAFNLKSELTKASFGHKHVH